MGPLWARLTLGAWRQQSDCQEIQASLRSSCSATVNYSFSEPATSWYCSMSKRAAWNTMYVFCLGARLYTSFDRWFYPPISPDGRNSKLAESCNWLCFYFIWTALITGPGLVTRTYRPMNPIVLDNAGILSLINNLKLSFSSGDRSQLLTALKAVCVTTQRFDWDWA